MKVPPVIYSRLSKLVELEYKNVWYIDVLKIYHKDGWKPEFAYSKLGDPNYGHSGSKTDRVGFDIKICMKAGVSFLSDFYYKNDYFSIEKSEYLQLIRDSKLKDILDENICS